MLFKSLTTKHGSHYGQHPSIGLELIKLQCPGLIDYDPLPITLHEVRLQWNMEDLGSNRGVCGLVTSYSGGLGNDFAFREIAIPSLVKR